MSLLADNPGTLAAAEPASAPKAVAAPKPEAFRPLPGAEPMPVLSALVANRCRWPVHTDDDPFANAARFFCGEQRVGGEPYCRTHDRLAYGAGTQSERSAARVLASYAVRAAG